MDSALVRADALPGMLEEDPGVPWRGRCHVSRPARIERVEDPENPGRGDVFDIPVAAEEWDGAIVEVDTKVVCTRDDRRPWLNYVPIAAVSLDLRIRSVRCHVAMVLARRLRMDILNTSAMAPWWARGTNRETGFAWWDLETSDGGRVTFSDPFEPVIDGWIFVPGISAVEDPAVALAMAVRAVAALPAG